MADTKPKKRTKKRAPLVPAPPKATNTVSPRTKKTHLIELGDHPLVHFQPTEAVAVSQSSYSEAEQKDIEDWWDELRELFEQLGDSPWQTGTPPFVGSEPSGFDVPYIIWTFCGGGDADPDNGVYGDDSENR